MKSLIGAHTTLAPSYPGFINVSRDEQGAIIVTVRGDPTTRDGCHICGFPPDAGQPGRCTPGDEHCNNYCNMAPQKGPMAAAPLPCSQTDAGATVSVRLTDGEWAALLTEFNSKAE